MRGDFNRDGLDDFIQVANALPGCIAQDPSASPEQKIEAARLHVDLDYCICNEVANQQKHFGRHTRSGSKPALVKAVRITPGARGFLDPSRSFFLGAGESIRFELFDGQCRDATAIVYRMTSFFRYVFEILPQPQSPIAITTLL